MNAKKEYVQLSQAKIEKVTNYQASKGLIKDHGMILKKYLHTYLCNFLKKKQDNEAYCFSAQFYLHPNVAVFG
ncbi:hypothetical protein [Cytobacillus stercorigallinarum]|uniref:hypothetical protein n=1 Tax=Cytobacillus stercorigallinarum TaxID=2762240 RepID=UPI001CD840FD|nr:hypothetical protein [Cytobacillus stercorigallinarum]